MPAAAWLGRSDAPGEIGGLGAADAGTCRDLAALARAEPYPRLDHGHSCREASAAPSRSASNLAHITRGSTSGR